MKEIKTTNKQKVFNVVKTIIKIMIRTMIIEIIKSLF